MSKKAKEYMSQEAALADMSSALVEALKPFLSVMITPDKGQSSTLVAESIPAPSVGELMIKESGLPPALPVKLIGPGWGSMAYYSEAMLKNSGPKAFPKGTHMYWNHPTLTEEMERPERSLDHLAAVLTEDAKWLADGPKGPGLYSTAKVFSDYAQQIEEKGPHMGLSIVAGIHGKEGEMEGKKGLIAEEFARGYSADFVTKAGAKGAPVMESEKSELDITVHDGDIGKIKQYLGLGKGPTMTPEEIKAAEKAIEDGKKAQEALAAENATLKKQLADQAAIALHQEAVKHVTKALTEAEVEFNPKMILRACASPVVKEGKLDPDWLKGIIEDCTPAGGGKVDGNGRGREADSKKEAGIRIRETMKRLGVPDAGLDVASSVN